MSKDLSKDKSKAGSASLGDDLDDFQFGSAFTGDSDGSDSDLKIEDAEESEQKEPDDDLFPFSATSNSKARKRREKSKKKRLERLKTELEKQDNFQIVMKDKREQANYLNKLLIPSSQSVQQIGRLMINPRQIVIPGASFAATLSEDPSNKQLHPVARRNPEALPLILDDVRPLWWHPDIPPPTPGSKRGCVVPVVVLTLSAVRGWELMTALDQAILRHTRQEIGAGEKKGKKTAEDDEEEDDKDDDEENAKEEEPSSNGESDSEQSDEGLKKKKSKPKAFPRSSAEKKGKGESKQQPRQPKQKPVLCLYGKHMKRDQQAKELQSVSSYAVAVATPGRLLSLLDTKQGGGSSSASSSSASSASSSSTSLLNASATQLVVVDMHHDSKSFCLFTLNDTSNDSKRVLREIFLPYILTGRTKILLF